MTLFKQLYLKFQYYIIGLFYFQYTIPAILYSWERDRVERAEPKPVTAEPFDGPGKLLKAESTPRGATFYFEQVELHISFLTGDLVRVDWKPGLEPIPYAIARQDWPEVETTLAETGDGWTLDSGELQMTVAWDGALQWRDRTGTLLRQEQPPQRKPEGWIHRAPLEQDERIYGLGERASSLNLRQAQDKKGNPKTFRIWNFDAAGKYTPGADPMYISIPLYLGLHHNGSYLIFYENSYEGHFTFADAAIADFEGGPLRYYLTAGPPQQLLERYTELTGLSPLPPRWALGYHQSRWGYRTEKNIQEMVEEFQARDLPLSAVHLDIDCQVGFRAFTIDPDRFPNLPKFTEDLLDKGVRFIAILNPGIKYSRQSNLFLEGQLLGAFCTRSDGTLVSAPVWPGWSVFPDFTSAKVRHWWSRQYRYLLDAGVSGFWHDMNEPACFVAWGDGTLPPRSTKHFMEGRGGDHREAHNLYGLLQAQAGYESLCNHHPDRRPFIVSRSGWAGVQRYAWTWTGDIESSWGALHQTIATVVGLGLSGIPYSGPDIGGFQGNPSPELYLRWFQMATFLPFYRTHSSNNVEARPPWVYGEPTLGIVREFLRLRYRLMPYFYTLAQETSQKGYPLVRPLFWADPQDSHLWDIEDGFLLGDALLVYAVAEKGMRSRSVRLPQGTWYDFWQERQFPGGQSVTVETPLEQIPVFVKAGSILPMEEGNCLTIHLYPPVEGSGTGWIYSDAGDGYDSGRSDRFYMVRDENGLEVRWEEEGSYPFPYTQVQVHVHGFQPQQAWMDDREVGIEGKLIQVERFGRLYVRGSD